MTTVFWMRRFRDKNLLYGQELCSRPRHDVQLRAECVLIGFSQFVMYNLGMLSFRHGRQIVATTSRILGQHAQLFQD